MSNMDRYADFIAKQNGSGLFGVQSTADKIDEAKQTETQHIEITSHTGHRKLVPVHPLNARKALDRYRGLTTTKSARIVSEQTIEEEGIDLDEGIKDNLKKAGMAAALGATALAGGAMAKKAHDYHKTDPAMGMSQSGVDQMTGKEYSGRNRVAAALQAAQSESVFDESKILDAHFEKQTPEVQNRLNTLLRRGHTYPDAVKKAGATPLGEEAEQIDEISDTTKHKYLDKADKFIMSDKAKLAKIDQRSRIANKVERDLLSKGQKSTSPLSGYVEEAEQVDESVAKVTDHLIKRYGDNVRSSHVRSAANDFGVDASKLSKSVRKKLGKTMLEDAEQLDELGPKTLGNYIKARQGTVLGSGMSIAQGDNSKDRMRKTSNAFTGVTRATNNLVKKALTKEDNKFLAGALKKLEEGRGRPPKEGSPAWHRRQAELSKGKDKEEPKALEVQLRKTISVNSPVTFNDGKSHDVHPNHAQKFMDHMAARRTSQEKHDFQKKASASHDAFKKAISEPVPGHKKDTGEIVKYR